MSDFLLDHDYESPHAVPPKSGIAVIDSGDFPNGTPLSPAATSVLGQRFTLIGKQSAGSAGANNSGDVYIGTTSANGQLVRLMPGDDGAIALVSPDNGIIDLRDYAASGADGDGVQWIRVL